MIKRMDKETDLKLSFVTGQDNNGEDIIESHNLDGFAPEASNTDLYEAGTAIADLYITPAEIIYRVDTVVLQEA